MVWLYNITTNNFLYWRLASKQTQHYFSDCQNWKFDQRKKYVSWTLNYLSPYLFTKLIGIIISSYQILNWLLQFFSSNKNSTCCINYAKIRVSLNRIFPYKDRIYDSVLIRENTSQRKPISWHIFAVSGNRNFIYLIE